MSTGRDPIEDHVIAAATLTGQPFETMACDPDLADTAAFCAAYGIAIEDSANTIVVATKEEPARYVACVVLATHRLDVNGVVRKRLNASPLSSARSVRASRCATVASPDSSSRSRAPLVE